MSEPLEPLHLRFRRSGLAAAIACKDIVLTITSGRSGTRLLMQLCRDVLEVDARHEPEPKANFAMRPMLADREFGLRWLLEDKLPAIAAYGNGPTYVETSNMYGKGFVELFFELGVVPRFVILRYDASRIARSWMRMGAVPEVSEIGKLVHLGPTDERVLLLPDWQRYSEYQLCYWYALEMQRRQDYYTAAFTACGIPHLACTVSDLVDWVRFADVAAFITRTPSSDRREAFDRIVAVNQNPPGRFLHGKAEGIVPHDYELQERQVDAAVARGTLTAPLPALPR